MKSGKIILMALIVLSSAIGLVTLQQLDTNENNTVTVNDFFSQAKSVKISLSDGVGSKISGSG